VGIYPPHPPDRPEDLVEHAHLSDFLTELRSRLHDWYNLSSVADAGGINTTATTITVPAGHAALFKVDGECLIEVASVSPELPETMRVMSVNEGANQITVSRGWLGSTPVAHAKDAIIKIFDEFPDKVLIAAINRAIETLWPEWYIVNDDTTTTEEGVREYRIPGFWIGLIEMQDSQGDFRPIRSASLLKDETWTSLAAIGWSPDNILVFHYDPPGGRTLRYRKAEPVRGLLAYDTDAFTPAELNPLLFEYIVLRAAHIAWQRKVTQRARFARLSASAQERVADSDAAVRLAYSFLNEAMMVKQQLTRSPAAMFGYMGFPRGRI